MASSTILRSLAFTLASLGILASAARAESMSFDAVADNTLYESATGALSNGSGDFLFVGRTAQLSDFLRRTVLEFDVSTLPAGAVVQSARLTMMMSMAISLDVDVTVHKVLSDWGEGASDAPFQEGAGAAAQAPDATWIHTQTPGSLWTTPGGDFEPTASAVQSVSGVANYRWESAQMGADVQDWRANPGSNFGWILIGDEISTTTTKRFNSRENLGFSPTLRVDYYLPSIMAGSVNAGAGPVTDVLLINSSAGGPERRVQVPTSTGFTVDFIAPPQGQANGRFALWIWIGLPCNPMLLSHDGEDIGTTVNATPLTLGSPLPFRCVVSSALPNAVCRDIRIVNGPQTYPFPTRWSSPAAGTGPGNRRSMASATDATTTHG